MQINPIRSRALTNLNVKKKEMALTCLAILILFVILILYHNISIRDHWWVYRSPLDYVIIFVLVLYAPYKNSTEFVILSI